MDKKSLLKKYSRLLQTRGFSDATAYGLRSSFDIITKKKDRVLLLKLVDNIDSISDKEANALKELSTFFDGEAFIIYQNYKNKKVNDKLIFSRHGISCVSSNTFEILLDGTDIARAQRFVKTKYKVDAELLKKMRALSGFSIRELSREVGVSKDTIYRYENARTFSTSRNLKKLEKFFDYRLTEASYTKIPEFQETMKFTSVKGISMVNLDAAPFNMLAKRHFRYEAGSQLDQRTRKKIAAFYRDLASVLEEDYPFFVTDSENGADNVDGIPIIKRKELAKIKAEKDLLDIISTRTKE